MGINIAQGVCSTVAGLAGAAAVVIWPDQIWIGYGLFASAGMLFLWGLRINGRHIWQFPWVKPPPTRRGAEAIIDQRVTSNHQSGGITAHTIVNQAPKPVAKVEHENTKTNSEKNIETHFFVELNTPYAVGRFTICAAAIDIIDMDVRRIGGGTEMWGNYRRTSQFWSVDALNAFGSYSVSVVTPKQTKVELSFDYSK